MNSHVTYENSEKTSTVFSTRSRDFAALHQSKVDDTQRVFLAERTTTRVQMGIVVAEDEEMAMGIVRNGDSLYETEECFTSCKVSLHPEEMQYKDPFVASDL